MSVRIVGQEPGARAALYDSVTGLAFGPVFESLFEAHEFLESYDPSLPDLRTLPAGELAKLVAAYRGETGEPGENPSYGPGNPDWERDFDKTREGA